MYFQTLKTVLLVLSLGLVIQCTHQEVNPEDPDSLFAEAEREFNDERYLLAIEKYRDIKNRFPYSKRAVDAELRIADSYYAQESFLEAESAYEIFRELHPTHPKIDYVQFRIGMSYFEMIPSNAARDLSGAHRAIDAFNVLIDRYPHSEYASQSKEKIIDSRRKLAEHESYVAEFYFYRKHYLSATYRYAALLQDYPKLGYDEEALFRLGECYFNTRMYSNAQDILARLNRTFPQSQYRGAAEQRLQQMNNNNQ